MFILSLIIKTPQYSETTFPLTCSIIKSCWNLGTVPNFMMHGSLPLNRKRNSFSFKVMNIFMSLINPHRLTFFWRSLSSLDLLQPLVLLLIILSFRIPQILHLFLLLLLIPLRSQFWSPFVAVLAKPRLLSPPKDFKMKYMAPMGLKIFYPPFQSPLDMRLIVPWPTFLV